MIPQNVPPPRTGGSFRPSDALRHDVFVDEIARRESGIRPWQAVACGLVVLRLLEAWADGEPCEQWGSSAIRRDILSLGEDDTTREPLLRLIDVMYAAPQRDFGLVAPLLAGYARALEFAADWQLAVDVYETLLWQLRGARLPLIAQCYIRLGACYRHLNCLRAAATAYRRARKLAMHSGDLDSELVASIGSARLTILRGNLPAAERIACKVLRRAKAARLYNAWGRALHDLGNIAFRRAEYCRAARHYFRAFRRCTEDAERDRILADLAHVFLRVRAFEIARDLYVVIASYAKEQWVRWAAYVNLLDIAGCTGDRKAFDRYDRILDRAKLTPELSVWHQLTAGEGLLRLADSSSARAHLKRALAMASEFGFNEALIDADRLLACSWAPLPVPVSEVPTGELREIASSLHRLRVSCSQ